MKAKTGFVIEFLKEEINVLDLKKEWPEIKYKVPFNGKHVTALSSFNQSSFIIYGTNSDEIYLQDISEQNSKPTKIDDCKSVCYQIIVDDKDDLVYICGMGYLKIFRFKNNKLELISSLQTSTRSMVLYYDMIVLNKGIHGLELYRLDEHKLVKLDSIEINFSIDLMRLNKTCAKLLVSSKPIGQLALINIVREGKKGKSLRGFFKF